MTEDRKWILVFAITTFVVGICICAVTIYVDPFMHYHAPLTDRFYYRIYMDIERNVNDGISRNFDYDSIITGTSMTENFMTSEAEAVFGESFIKVPFAGARYQEINDNLHRALRSHPNTKRVIRGLDTLPSYWNSYNEQRNDLGEYPYYLNNDNPFDDVIYLFNRKILYTRDYQMIEAAREGDAPGITHFNNYSHWMFWDFVFGYNSVLEAAFQKKDVSYFFDPDEIYTLTDEEQETLAKNIVHNVTDLAGLYPEVEFDYFFTPYSAACWGLWNSEGNLDRQISVEEQIIKMILPYENIHLFSWDDCFNVTGDLNNYKDPWHYAEWVNSWILTQIKNDAGRITEENYQEYIRRLKEHYASYDFNSLFQQDDYEADYYGAIVLDPHICQSVPVILGFDENRYTFDEDTGEIEFNLDATLHRALEFYGMRTDDNGKARVEIYDSGKSVVRSVDDLPMNPNDNEWHRYVLGLSGIEGQVTVKISKVKPIDKEENAVIQAQDFAYKDFKLY